MTEKPILVQRLRELNAQSIKFTWRAVSARAATTSRPGSGHRIVALLRQAAVGNSKVCLGRVLVSELERTPDAVLD